MPCCACPLLCWLTAVLQGEDVVTKLFKVDDAVVGGKKCKGLFAAAEVLAGVSLKFTGAPLLCLPTAVLAH